MWLNRVPYLLLASASPRRVEILQQMQVPAKQLIVPSPPGEDEPRKANEAVVDYVVRTANDKLSRAQQHSASQEPLQGLPILTADTTVAIEQTILGKPDDEKAALEMLSMLSGVTHDVYTAISLHHNQQTYRALSHSIVTFDTLSPDQMTRYVASGEPFGKAGAYAIQGQGAQFIKQMNGSFSAVMGLPVYELSQLLRQAKLIA
jgi:septum formation protein